MGLQASAKEAKRNGKDKKSKVTVVMPTYNRSGMLREALESVICQETDGKFSFEIVVVDNASTDSTKAVVHQVAATSPVLVRYVLEQSQGQAPKPEWAPFLSLEGKTLSPI